MRNRGDIGDLRHTNAQCVKRPHSGFAPRARALNTNFDVFNTALNGHLAGSFGGHLGGKGRAFSRALKAGAARSCPRKGIALSVGDGNDGVVKRGMNMGHGIRDVLTNLLLAALTGATSGFCHNRGPLFLKGDAALARSLAGAGIGAGALTTNRQAFTVTQSAIAAEVHQTLDRH